MTTTVRVMNGVTDDRQLSRRASVSIAAAVSYTEDANEHEIPRRQINTLATFRYALTSSAA